MALIYGSLNYTASGRKKKTIRRSKPKFTGITVKNTEPYRRDTPEYKSAPDTNAVAAKKDSPQYTGTLVKGIGTMHKSNAIPIIDEEQMKDIARMRR